MSTAARKARKRAGIKFTKEPKEGTPLLHGQQTEGVVGVSNPENAAAAVARLRSGMEVHE